MCTLTLANWAVGCKSIGGVTALYVIDKADRISNSITYAIANSVLTITGTGGTYYKIDPTQNSFSISNPTNASGDANSLFYLQSIAGMMHGNTAAGTALVEQINKGRTEWLVEFADGTYRMMGTDTAGMEADGGDGLASGQAAGDAKGSTLSLSCQSTYIAPTVAFDSFTAAFTQG